MAAQIRPKLAMIGLDGAELSLILSHLWSLPNLRRALESGVLRRLNSTAGLLTGSVWPTFYTGTLPGEHGIYHTLQWDPQGMCLRRVSADWLHCEPFWCEIERRGLGVIALDVPMTFPSRLKRGTEITTWGSHDELSPFSVHPKELEDGIRRRFGEHPMGSEIPVMKTRRQRRRIRTDLLKGARLKGELCRWLVRAREWEFFIAVFGETHRGGHVLWPQEGVCRETLGETGLLDLYQEVDKAVGGILDSLRLEETTVVVFSLHGMGPNTSQEHFVPKIMDRANRQFVGSRPMGPDGSRPPGRRSIMRVLRERLPGWLQNAIAQAVPVAVRDMVVSRSLTAGHDWRFTPAIALRSDRNAYVRFNVLGREAKGTLKAGGEDLAGYADWIDECFRSFRIAGSGRPLVRDVVFANREFPGGRSSLLPDVIVPWAGVPPATRIHSEKLGSLTGKLDTGRTGNHTTEGFCIVLEPGSGRRGEESRGHIVDLAPMVLRRLLATAPSQ